MNGDPRRRRATYAVAAAAAAIVLVGAVPRLLVAGDALPEWLRPFIWSDVLLTWARGLSGGRLPYWDSYFEYPPLIGYLSALFSLAAPTGFAYVALWAVVQAAAAALTAVVLLAEGAGRRAVRAWVLAPELALLAPINFDVLPILALVLAVRWARASTSFRAVAAVALGTVAKLFPAAALPIVLLRSGWDARAVVLRIALFAAVVAVAYAPAAAAPFSSLESIGRYSVGIGTNFDSIWGIVAGLLEVFGADPTGLILVISTVGLVVTYVAFVLPHARTARDPAAPIALAVFSVLLWSRLYSPQFSLWALPFFALLPLPGRALGLLMIADVAVFGSVYPLTLLPWTADDPVSALLFGVLAAGVVLRHVALAIAWLAARRVVIG